MSQPPGLLASMCAHDPLLSLAESQHGLVTRVQALAAGLSDDMVDGRVRRGRLQRLARDVYRIPGSVPTWRQSLLAAILTAGPGAVASHRSAAALWKIPGFDPGPVEVTRRRGRSRVAHIGSLHETRCLPPSHVALLDSIPRTCPERTLLDPCAAVHPRRAERALDNALAMKLVSLARLQVVLAETGKRGRGGCGVLRRLLATRQDGYVPPESELEALVLAVLEAGGLERPARQVVLGGDTSPIGRVDFVYRRARLVLEADSRRHHSSWLDTEADRRRDAALLAAGWQVLRVTWDQLVACPDELVAAVRGALRRAA